MIGTVSKLLQPLKDRVMLMVARGVLKVVNDQGGLQVAQVSLLEDELRDKVERFQNYGYTSNPLPGAEGVAVFVGGNRDHGLLICVDDRRYRITGLKGGEVAIYTDEGDYVHFKRDRHIEMKSLHVLIDAEEDFTVNTKIFSVNADRTGIHTNALDMTNKDGGDVRAKLQGCLDATDDVTTNNGAVSGRGHVHFGVQPGNSDTAKPVGG